MAKKSAHKDRKEVSFEDVAEGDTSVDEMVGFLANRRRPKSKKGKRGHRFRLLQGLNLQFVSDAIDDIEEKLHHERPSSKSPGVQQHDSISAEYSSDCQSQSQPSSTSILSL